MENRHGGDVYSYENILDFSANINPLGPPEHVLSYVKESLSAISDYPDVRCRELKRKLSERLGCDSSQLIIGNGAADLIFTLVLAERPKKALITAPGFAEYEQALHVCETEVQFWNLCEKEDFGLPESFLKALTPELDIVFLCTPNNPTGQLIDTELLGRIAEKCEQLDIRLVVDECFLDFAEDGKRRSMLGKISVYKRLFILKSFTKMYALAGLRLGYGVCSDTVLLEQMELCRQPWGISILAQAAGIAAVEEREYEEQTRQAVRRERNYLCDGLSRLGIRYWEPAANYIFFRSVPGLKEKLTQRGILIRDCSNYRNLKPGYYRIAVKLREDNGKLLRALEEVLSAEKKGENDAESIHL